MPNFVYFEPLIIPVIMILIGLFVKKFPPKKSNWFYGYRTKWSKKSRDTWEFAQQYNASLNVRAGVILLAATLAVEVVYSGADTEGFYLAAVITQTAAILAAVLMTELALRKNFDKTGVRKISSHRDAPLG